MSENQHATQAVSRLRNGTHNEVARATVEATIALAYEQRTANLIALWTAPDEPGNELAGVDYGDLAKQIRERLGLV